MLLFNTINDVQLHFFTPILCKRWPEAETYNPGLAALIRQKREESPGVVLSNRGGWQSSDDLARWEHPSIAALMQWIYSSALQIHHTFYPDEFPGFIEQTAGKLNMQVTAWANINGPSHWNAAHNHPAAYWSGAYYVEAPQGSAHIAFVDPRPNINMVPGGGGVLDLFEPVPHTIEPQAGLLVIFPSWLQHYVMPQEIEHERISLSFNARLVVVP